MMTDLEITEQTLWCIEATRDDQCADDPRPPSDELVRFWQDQVLHHKELQKLDERNKNEPDDLASGGEGT